MKKTDLYILMFEDDPLDVDLCKAQLTLLDEYNCIVQWVANQENYIKALENSYIDIVLSDYNLPRYNGMEALNDLTKRNKMLPFIFVTGTMKEEVAADAIKAGAWDYVVKDRLFRLPLAVRNVLKIKKEKLISLQAEEKAHRLLMAIEQTSAQIVVSNVEGKIEYVNKKYTEVTGFQTEEVIGKDIALFASDNDKWGSNEQIINKIKNGEIFRGEIISKKKDDTTYWELVSVTPIKNINQKITHFVAVKEDISQSKEMEQALLEALEKAKSSDKLKEAFLQNISHEIRTPMNAIVGFSELLKGKELQNFETIQHYTSVISNSSKQLLSIINDILTVASIQTNQETVYNTEVNIYNLFDQLDEIFNPIIKGKNLQFTCIKPIKDEEITTITDGVKLEQILTNLLNNAARFTHHGSIELNYSFLDDKIKFNVKDTGIGIAKDCQDLIFERFRQASPQIHIDYGGNGLGLSISKAFAEMIDGTISVESEPNVGSDFCLTIPFKPSKKIKPKPAIAGSSITSLNILIAEDELNNYFLFEAILGKHNLYHAFNGQEAVEICNENENIDLVLMDIKMPVMDGISAFHEIKKFRPNIPIIAQTAYALENDKKRLLEIGFTDYIAKPIRTGDLFEKIQKVLQKSND